MKNELWTDIRGYEGFYQISSLGRVRSLDRVIVKDNGKLERRKGSIRSTCVKKGGYVHVTLTKDKVATSVRVHRLVAEHFIPNPNNHKTVNHIRGIKTDNRACQLEWCTLTENVSHSHRIGLSDKKGELHPGAKLKDDQVREIRETYRDGVLNQYQLADKFSVSVTQICNIVNNKIWRHIL